MEAKKKIFLVDDDVIIHEAISAALPPTDCEIIHAYDGHDVIERIKKEQPDLVILDIMMPRGDGRDICRDLRADPKTKDMKILMLSAKDEQSDRILGLTIGADDYITKPLHLTIVASTVKRMCGMD